MLASEIARMAILFTLIAPFSTILVAGEVFFAFAVSGLSVSVVAVIFTSF
jgi:hypothetical protein